MFSSKSAVFFGTYVRRARARKPHARAPCARAVRTVCANRTRGLYGKSVCQISLCCFQNLMHVFFFQICCVFFSNLRCSFRTYDRGRTVWHARVRCARRAARTRARVRCTAHALGVRVRSAQCACMARVRLMSVAQPARSAADAFEPSFRSLGLLCFLSNKKYPHSLTPM